MAGSMGQTLRRLRDETGKSRRQVAADLGIAERTLIRHEDGTTQLTPLLRRAYADYYGVDIDVFEPKRRRTAA